MAGGPPAAYPPPPWRLRGRAALVAIPIRTGAAEAAGVPPGARLLRAGARTLGGLLLAEYDETATLPYRELIVFSGLAVLRGRPAFVVSHLYVDSDASVAGGRAIWGLPKELATFTALDGRVAVRRHDGVPLVTLAVTTHARRVTVPLLAPVLGMLAGRAVRAAGVGRLTASPGHAEVEIPGASPLAPLALAGRHAAFAGDRLDLPLPGPKLATSEIDP